MYTPFKVIKNNSRRIKQTYCSLVAIDINIYLYINFLHSNNPYGLLQYYTLRMLLINTDMAAFAASVQDPRMREFQKPADHTHF